MPVAIAGTQTALAGTHPGAAGTGTAGTGWVLQTPPAPVSTFGGPLNGVSCASADACMAVGDFETSTGEAPFAEAWNGTSWTLDNVPALATTVDLYGVSCPSTSSCIAVGVAYSRQLFYYMPLAEIWNGTSWSSQILPLPPGALSANLYSVSCPAVDRCVAVGPYGTAGSFSFSESWNGTTWTAHAATVPGDPDDEFDGVSCRSYRSCVAVGSIRTSSGFGPMAASWNGRSWTVQGLPAPSGSTEDGLQAVSCHSAADCMAVGDAGGPSSGQTLAEQWNGTAWTIVSMPQLGGAKAANSLFGVSCPRATRCTAVGDVTRRGKVRLLAEHWNGTRWQVDATAEPPQVSTSVFGGVSCLPRRSCIAVGDYFTGTATAVPLAEQHSAVQHP